MKTSDYLEQLIKDVNTVRTKLNSQGVVTDPKETLTTLAPKIGIIGTDLGTVVYMRLFDCVYSIQDRFQINENNYDAAEVYKVDKLIETLGGELDG